MPFNGGGSGSLPNHEHSSVPLDGGPLDFAGTTIGSMNAGDLTYSSGVALQQLAIGAPNDELRVSAGNLPEWYTPSAGASVWTELVNTKIAGAVAPLNGSWAGHYDILSVYIFCQPDGANVTGVDFNLDTGTNYNGATTTTSWTNERSSDIGINTSNFNYTHMWIYNHADKRKLYYIDTTTDTGAGSSPGFFQSWGQWENTVDSISSLQVVCRNSGASIDYKVDSHLLVLGQG